MGTFPSMLAIDTSGSAASNAEGQIFAPDDTNALVALSPTDLFGFPFPADKLVASSLGILPSFMIDGFTAVMWVSGGFRITIPCIDQVPTGGTTGQYLAKVSAADYDVEWRDGTVSEGGGGGTVEPGASFFSELQGIPTPSQSAPGAVLAVLKNGSTWPQRPTDRTDVVVLWIGLDPSPIIVDSGTGGMLRNKDIRMVTA